MNNVENKLVAAFTGKYCHGNRHEVFETVAPLEALPFLQYSRNTPHIVVVIAREAQEKGSPGSLVKLGFFQHGREIKRCGSGSVAAAHTLFTREYLSPAQAQQQATPARELAVSTTAETLVLLKNHRRVGYRSKKLPLFRETSPKFWQKVCGLNRNAEAVLDGKVLDIRRSRGYTIVHVASAMQVQHARPHLRRLRLLHPHSLILTAQAPLASPYDYVLRYFAPRHAPREDAATGSANSLLLQYWSELGLRGPLRGLQLSEQGGEFYGHVLPPACGIIWRGTEHIN